MHAGRACSTRTFSILSPRHRADLEAFKLTTRSCAPARRPASARRILAHQICSATKPILRLTPLPTAGTMTIEGIAGVRRLAMSSYRCSLICSSQIVTGL